LVDSKDESADDYYTSTTSILAIVFIVCLLSTNDSDQNIYSLFTYCFSVCSFLLCLFLGYMLSQSCALVCCQHTISLAELHLCLSHHIT